MTRFFPSEWQSSRVVKGVLIVVLIILAGIAAILIGDAIPVGVDFHYAFYPVARAILGGQSPYIVPEFLMPPWAAIFVTPFGLLPEKVAWGAFVIVDIFCYIYAFRRMEFDRISIALMMVSPFVFYGAFHGNLEFLVLVGSILPLQIGVWFLIIKPQMSFPLLLFLAYRIWQAEGWKSVALKFGPPTLIYTLFLVTGWMNIPNLSRMPWNTSAWPWGLPLGVLMVVLALIKNDKLLAFAAGPFFSPYLAFHTWVVTLLPYRNKRVFLAIFIVLSWVVLLQRGYPL